MRWVKFTSYLCTFFVHGKVDMLVYSRKDVHRVLESSGHLVLFCLIGHELDEVD
jgi:hypothetical protein